MEVLELTITSCLHLVRNGSEKELPSSMGSGVIVKYKERFFICTVSHFSDHNKEKVGIVTGRTGSGQSEIYELGDFSYLTQIKFDEVPNATDLEYSLENYEEKGVKLDIAFREVSLLDNIYQHKREIDLNELGKLTINEGGKSMCIVDDDYEIDGDQLCSFYGRIRPSFFNGVLDFQECLYWGLTIENIGEHFIKMDLGSPIADHSRFKGCSGAPILDTRGRLIGLVTHGDDNVNSSSIYGFRFDVVKHWIDLMYFQEPISKL